MQLSASSPKSHVVDSSIFAQSRYNDPCNVVRALCFMSHSRLSNWSPLHTLVTVRRANRRTRKLS